MFGADVTIILGREGDIGIAVGGQIKWKVDMANNDSERQRSCMLSDMKRVKIWHFNTQLYNIQLYHLQHTIIALTLWLPSIPVDNSGIN